jgi:hypothetical protein
LTPHHFSFSPSRGPASVLSHRPETNAKKEGKEFVKFVDGLANVASNRPRRPKWAWASSSLQLSYSSTATDADFDVGYTGSADPYGLPAEVLAVQQPQKGLRHTFDPLKYILFETNFSLKRSFPASCHSARRLSASSRLCHQSSTRNPWTLARDTMS